MSATATDLTPGRQGKASWLWRRQLDDVTMLAATVSLALLGNAFICGVISGPHDRYGARVAWIVTFAIGIALLHAIGRRPPKAGREIRKLRPTVDAAARPAWSLL